MVAFNRKCGGVNRKWNHRVKSKCRLDRLDYKTPNLGSTVRCTMLKDTEESEGKGKERRLATKKWKGRTGELTQ